MKYIIFFITTILSIVANAQLIKDTSFTIHSAFVKEQKKYPFIQIAAPAQPTNVREIREVVYRIVGQRTLFADVYLPISKQKKTFPAVLMLFGGGWRSGDKLMCLPMARMLSSQGFVVVAIEYRLSPEAPYPAALHDAKAAVRWMRANAGKYQINRKQIAVHGVSAGGQLAALLGSTNHQQQFEDKLGNVKHSSAVQAVIDVDGILAFHHPESGEGKVAAEFLGGTYIERPAIWKEASALSHVSKHSPPILFINSSNPRFHAGRDDMISRLDSLHIYSEVYTLNNTPHPFWLFHPWFQPAIDYSVNFLKHVFANHSKV